MFHLFICQQFQHAVNSLLTFTISINFFTFNSFFGDQLGVNFDYLLFETCLKLNLLHRCDFACIFAVSPFMLGQFLWAIITF